MSLATCDDLSLTNGVITYNPASSPRLDGATATHTCNTGYELSGDTVNPRVCQSDRSWSGGDITCLGEMMYKIHVCLEGHTSFSSIGLNACMHVASMYHYNFVYVIHVGM